jgi:hypothetical protein
MSEPLKQREGDQPLPTKNDLPCVQDLVIADIEARKAIGIQRYGTTLQPFNGRDVLLDIYEESIDRLLYIRQLMYERDHPCQAASGTSLLAPPNNDPR